MNTQKHSQEVTLHPTQIAQDQVAQIGKLINEELSKLVLEDENSTINYVKNIIQLEQKIVYCINNSSKYKNNEIIDKRFSRESVSTKYYHLFFI